MSTPPPSVDQTTRLADRYGTGSTRGRLAIIVATTIVAGAGLGWLIWAAWFHANPAAQGGVLGFTVTGDHSVSVTVQAKLRRDVDQASCVLTAYALDHANVGEREVRITHDGSWKRTGGTTVERIVTLKTERRATAVELTNCRTIPAK